MFYCFRVRRYVRRYFVKFFKFPKYSKHPLENVVSSSVVMCIARPQAVVETSQSQQPIWHHFDNGATSIASLCSARGFNNDAISDSWSGPKSRFRSWAPSHPNRHPNGRFSCAFRAAS